MSTFIPEKVQAGLDAARQARGVPVTGLHVETGAGQFPILRLWADGFSVAREDAPCLRGFVDVYEGSAHLFHGLVVTSVVDGDEACFDFKRMTVVTGQPPRDFAEPELASVARIIDDVGTGVHFTGPVRQ